VGGQYADGPHPVHLNPMTQVRECDMTGEGQKTLMIEYKHETGADVVVGIGAPLLHNPRCLICSDLVCVMVCDLPSAIYCDLSHFHLCWTGSEGGREGTPLDEGTSNTALTKLGNQKINNMFTHLRKV
jgi:hypothetical protein